MSINQAIWKIDETPARLAACALDSEDELEEMICNDMGMLNEEWLAVGRQVPTGHGGWLDLLAINENGDLIVIELKKSQTPREVVTQAMDYASWVRSVRLATLAEIYESSREKLRSPYGSLDEALRDNFDKVFTEGEIDGTHQIVIVASALDPSTERIVKYLSDYEVPINTVFFSVFKDGENRYISRAWLIDPVQTQEHANLRKDSAERAAWNQEYYVSFGHDMGRHWEDARRYGFVSAGGGKWYSQTLNQLSNGDRIWVNIPRTGYVGVGIVEEPAVMAKDFRVQVDDKTVPITEAPLKLRKEDLEGFLRKHAADPEKAEYFVRVRWIRADAVDEAVKQVGFFGNQNSVCRPRKSSWLFTVDTLKNKWGVS